MRIPSVYPGISRLPCGTEGGRVQQKEGGGGLTPPWYISTTAPRASSTFARASDMVSPSVQLLSLTQCSTPDEASAGFSYSSPLSPRFWAVGPIRPSLVRGLRPRNAPGLARAAVRSRQCQVVVPRRPGLPPQPRFLARTEYVPAQARQARQLPHMPSVHRYDHRKAATEILTVYSLQTDRTQHTQIMA